MLKLVLHWITLRPFHLEQHQGAMDLPVSTFLAGDKEVEFSDDYNTDGFIFVKQDQALPLTVLALYPTIVN